MRTKETKQSEAVLEKAGFSDKETAIYLALLKLGHGTVSEITRAANVGRTYGYPILDALAAKGLITISGKRPKQEYFAESPRKLFTLMEKNVESQKQMLGEVKELLPELIVLHNAEDRPKVRFYEGIEGLKEVYEDTLTAKEGVVRGFLAYEELVKALPNYFPDYFKRRAGKTIKGRAIATDTAEARTRVRHNREENREITLVPKEYYFYPEIDVYDNKVMIASWREKLGITIESDEIADAMKKIFELAWIGAETLETKKVSYPLKSA